MIRLILLASLAFAVFAAVRHLWGGARRLIAQRDQHDVLQQQRQERNDAARNVPGGNPQDPITISSPAVVEPRAQSMRCPQCDGTCLLDQHTVEVHGGVSLRVAHLVCQRCGAPRTVYFRLQQVLSN